MGETFDVGRPTPRRAVRRVVPRPLRVIKRVEKERGYRKSLRSPSFETDESLDDALDKLEDNKPVTIPKRRGNRGDQIIGGPTKDNAASFDHADTPKPRRSTSCTTPQRLRNYLASQGLSSKPSSLFLSGSDFMDRSIRHGQQEQRWSPSSNRNIHLSITPKELHSDSPRRAISSESDPFPSSHDSPEGTNPPSPVGSPLSPVLHIRDDMYDFPGPYLLAPKIVVTPENGALNDKGNAIWVAVEISTQLCRASGTEGGRTGHQDQYMFHPGTSYAPVFRRVC